MTPDGLTVRDWRPRYRESDKRWGLAWDSCISADDLWLMDCGDIEPVRRIHTTVPDGRFAQGPGSGLSWRQPVPWTGALRLIRISLADQDDVSTGDLFDRVSTGTPIANGMFLTPGGDRDVYHCGTTAVSRVVWQ